MKNAYIQYMEGTTEYLQEIAKREARPMTVPVKNRMIGRVNRSQQFLKREEKAEPKEVVNILRHKLLGAEAAKGAIIDFYSGSKGGISGSKLVGVNTDLENTWNR